MKKLFLLTLLISGLFLLVNMYFLLIVPPIWPDEVLFSSVTESFINTGLFRVSVWEPLSTFGKDIMYLPPVFFLIQSLLIRVASLNIFYLRVLSLVFASICLIIIGAYAQLTFHTKKILYFLLPLVLTGIDNQFIQGAHISRMEIFVLTFALLSFYAYTVFEKGKSLKKPGKYNYLFFILAAIFSALAFLTHVLGIFVFISIFCKLLYDLRENIRGKYQLLIFSGIFFSVCSVWFLSPHFKLDEFIYQVSSQADAHHSVKSWFFWYFSSRPDLMKILLIAQFGISIAFIVRVFWQEKKNDLLAWLIIFSWAFAAWGGSIWYFIYPLPFIYLAAIKLLQNLKSNQFLTRLSLILTLIVISINLYLTLDELRMLIGQHSTYTAFGNELSSLIPSQKSVFLSVIPDPYFILRSQRDDLKFYEFPTIKEPIADYLKMLDASDFVIINGEYEAYLYGHFLKNYVDANTAKVYLVGRSLRYQAYLIELTPGAKRVHPTKQ